MARFLRTVGVNNYRDPGIRDLKYAERDARELASIFKRDLGYDAEYLEERKSEDIEDCIEELGSRLKPGDTFIFFFAGHGHGHAGDQLFLLPGVKRAALDDGATVTGGVLSFKTLCRLTETPAWNGVQRIFIFDSCRAPIDSKRDGGEALFSGEACLRGPGMAFNKKGTNVPPYTLINACGDGQSAAELPDGQGRGTGALTAVLIEAIESGMTQIDASTSERLGQRMEALTLEHGLGHHKQRPYIWGELPVKLYEPEMPHARKADEEAGRQSEITQLLEDFERQLAAGQFDSPPYDCLKDTMEALRLERHKQELMRELHKRIEAAKESGEQRQREEEKRKAEALREQETREAAETERKLKVAEEARLAQEKLAQEAIDRRQREETELSERRAAAEKEAREAKEAAKQRARKESEAKAIQEAEALRVAEQAARVAAEQRASAEARAKQQKLATERHQSDEKAWKDTQNLAATSHDLSEKKRHYEAYANRWSLYREQAQTLTGELDIKIKRAAQAALEMKQAQAQETLRLKTEQAAFKAVEHPQQKDLPALNQTEEIARLTYEAAWTKAKQLDSIASYSDFLKKHPTGEFKSTANSALIAKMNKESKGGIPGWFWVLGVIVLGGMALIPIFGGEKPAQSPVTDEAGPAPAAEPPITDKAEQAPAAAYTPAQVAADLFAGEMVAIPLTGRPFSMGDNSSSFADEKPAHPVTIRHAYELGRTEVTQGQWKAVMGSNPSYFKTCGDNCPVERVSWDDIQQFLRKLNDKTGKQYRLPTEAEWEYACRAGGTETYCGGNDIDAVAWYGNEKSGRTVHPVAQKQKNAFGLYDMSGNVWEWVQDCSHDSYHGAPDDGSEWKGSCSGGDRRVLRGGSWFYDPVVARSANRGWSDSSNRSINGFRLARMLP